MIDKMTRFDFILLSSESESFLTELQSLGVVDITRSVKAIDDKSAAMMAEADSLKKRITLLEKENWAQDERYAEIGAAIADANREAAERAHWGAFDPAAIASLEAAGQKFHFYCIPVKKFDASWAEQWPIEVISENGTFVWFVLVGDAAGFPAAECEGPKGTSDEALGRAAELQRALEARRAELLEEKAGVEALRKRYSSLLADTDFYFASAAAEQAAENTITVITGFAPSDNEAALAAKFDEAGIFYLKNAAAVEDNPPIKLKNNKFVGMFEMLTDMYGRPAYDGFDPTPFISIFFLLFFAMCMGDAGYGILLVIIGFLLKKVKSFAKFSPLVVTLGIATFVVGFLFHTFFSVDISKWACIPDCLKAVMVPAKIATYDGTMVLALIVGIVHLCLAMIVKTVYATKNKGFLGSLSVWGWTLLIVGGVAVGAFALTGVLDAALTKIIVIVLGCVSALGIFFLNNLHRNPLMNVGAGLWETYNTATGILGDVLSYLRLYALGLAGSMLGFAFNDLAKMALGDGGFGWVAFILIVVIGHTLNIAMAALGAFVHPLRLNFLEFFKNSGYEGSGRKYNPLKK